MRYTYSAALRFAVAAGEPLAPWGPHSVLASVTLVPPDPPSAPHTPVATADAAGVTVSCAHSQDLSGSAVGVFVLRLLRAEPGHVPEVVDERSAAIAAGPAGSLGGPFTLRDPRLPTPGTTYRVVCVDPTGRPSLPSEPVSASA
jgi:hypothetical protein